MENKLKEILQQLHESCEYEKGYLKQLTLEEITKMHEQMLKDCDWCPFNTPCKICGGLEDYLYHGACYNCNKCGKWTVPDEEEYNKSLLQGEGFEKLISRGSLY